MRRIKLLTAAGVILTLVAGMHTTSAHSSLDHPSAPYAPLIRPNPALGPSGAWPKKMAQAAPAFAQSSSNNMIRVSAFSVQREVSPRQVEHRNWQIFELTLEGERKYREVIKVSSGQHGASEQVVQERSGWLGEEDVSGLRRSVWRRVDADTIVRAAEFPAHRATTTIKLIGSSLCEAQVDIELKPGHTLFEGPRTGTGERMLMDILRYEQVTCMINSMP